MAAAYRHHTTIAAGSRTNTTFTAPTGIQNGDTLLCIMTGGDAGNTVAPTITGPTGFAHATGSGGSGVTILGGGSTYAVAINVLWKVAASEAGNYTFTHAAADTEGILYAISGANTTTPLTPTMTTNYAASGATTTWLSITPTVDGSFLVVADLGWNAAGPAAVPAGTTPTFTERYDPGAGGVLYVADGVLTTAAATGNKTHTNNSGQDWAAVFVCVQAAGAGNKELDVDAGSYAVTGTAASLERGYRLFAEPAGS